jgi:hypothetical protein
MSHQTTSTPGKKETLSVSNITFTEKDDDDSFNCLKNSNVAAREYWAGRRKIGITKNPKNIKIENRRKNRKSKGHSQAVVAARSYERVVHVPNRAAAGHSFLHY